MWKILLLKICPLQNQFLNTFEEVIAKKRFSSFSTFWNFCPYKMFFFHFQETIPLCKLYLIIFQIFKWWKHHLASSGFHFKKLSFLSFKENSPVSQPGSTWKDDQAKDNGKCSSRVLSCLWSGTLILWQRKVLKKLISNVLIG